ncbi:TlpA family protein disulfide reductase [Chitinophaga oryzae]|uniref:TlpA family protein disulfide reductase n=1 Tax=Chitinophaga oryzae TaxID=2725414 RepID=A0AAE7D5I0_9BACT|nr:TlpA disulfide reductase family protein [Chitinophaga oryzae]QJB30089.1 TlpA family protein disulfide reductase [Chitinophaga oryzae]QJB36586.1 TlpA family protein disulfide reductase [Chitinophaga oryzae]
MKKAGRTGVLLALLAAPAALHAQQNKQVKSITVKGSVEFTDPKATEQKVWLLKDNLSGKPVAVDSTIVGKDNTFTFHVKQDHQGIYVIDALHWDRASFWSDADVKVAMRGYDTARYKVKIPHYNYVEGSYDNNFINMMTLNGELNYRRMIDEYNMEYYAKKSTDTTWSAYMKNTKKYNPMRDDYKQREDVLIRSFIDRPVLVYALRGMAGTENTAQYEKAMKMLEALIVRYPWLTEAQKLKQTILTNRAQAMKLKTGEPMPSVKYPSAQGTIEGLEKYKGKYLLVDFWASWCGPCRQAIPKVKALYSAFKDKGFEVVSISIDTDQKAWKKAMTEEAMPWEQLLSDNKDKTMEQFQFSGIPTLYLVDRQGKILERFTGYSDEAEAKVKDIVAKGTQAEPKKTAAMPMMGF